jgi:hypothetical protein
MAGSIHEQLIELISQLGDRAVAKKQARHIRAVMLTALSRGRDIGQDARPRLLRPTATHEAGRPR